MAAAIPPAPPPPTPPTRAGPHRGCLWALGAVVAIPVVLIATVTGVYFAMRSYERSPRYFEEYVGSMARMRRMRVLPAGADSTFRLAPAGAGDTIVISPADLRHHRYRTISPAGRPGAWYGEDSPDLFGHRLPPGPADVEVEGGGIDNAPGWVPRYPGIHARPGPAARRDSVVSGRWTLESGDSLARLAYFYRDEFEREGLALRESSYVAAGVRTGTRILARDPGGRREARVEIVHPPEGPTRVRLEWRQAMGTR